MARLIFITQRVDPTDPLLGFVPGWIDALAALVDQVDVVANEVAPSPRLADNVRLVSLGKERGTSRFSKGLHFEHAIWRLARRDTMGVVAHMCPVYLNLAWPITKARGIPSLLWFAHPSETFTLRIAESLAHRVITSLPGAYPRLGSKVRAIGQAIDLEAYPFTPLRDRQELSLVAVGRTSPIKGFDTVVRAMDLVRRRGRTACLRIVGPSSNSSERRHRDELSRLIRSLRLNDAVSLEPGVPPAQVPALMQEADLLLNATGRGSGDKVVFEAAASGRPTITSNLGFAPFFQGLSLELMFREGDPQDLADRIVSYGHSPLASKRLVASELHRRVVDGHSLSHWAGSVVDLLRQKALDAI